MSSLLVEIINLIGSIIGTYCIVVSIRIFKLYRLRRLFYFILTSISIAIWNYGHFILGILPSNADIFAKVTWYFVIGSGMLMVISVILGYHLLRFEYLQWNSLLYVFFVSFYMTIFYFRPDIITVKFLETAGWSTYLIKPLVWSSFSLLLTLIIIYEIEIPMFHSYQNSTREVRRSIILVIIGINLALFSNSLLLIPGLPFPVETRFVIADLGFLIFFMSLYRNPFIGIHDEMVINQAIIANSSGEVLYTKTNERLAMLTSGAIIGVQGLLENTSLLIENSRKKQNEFKRIEVGPDHYFTATEDNYIIIFHYTNTTGVGIQKLKSLSRIFGNDMEFDFLQNEFINLLDVYFHRP